MHNGYYTDVFSLPQITIVYCLNGYTTIWGISWKLIDARLRITADV